MFRRQGRVSGSQGMRTSDRRRLSQRVGECWGEEFSRSLFNPHRDEVVRATVEGDATVYSVGGDPLMFETEGGVMLPSLYALWKCQQCPANLVTAVTHGAVLERLVGGAHLMLPGVTGGTLLEPSASWRRGDPAVVMVPSSEGGTLVPVAVGVVECDPGQVRIGAKGKAVDVAHVYKDYLWAMGQSKTLLEDVESSTPRGATAATAPAAAASPSSVDELDSAMEAGLQIALGSVRKEDLPMLASEFYARLVVPNSQVDIKKTRFKKVGKLLQWAKEQGLVELETDQEKGQIFLASVKKSHPLLAPHAAAAQEAQQREEEEEERSGGRVTEFFVLADALRRDLLLPEGSSGELSRAQVKEVLFQYCRDHKLDAPNNRGSVLPDPVLSRLLGKKTPGVVEKRELVDRVLGANKAFKQYYRINSEDVPERERVRRGSPPLIVLKVERRGGNKKVTRISGLESYALNPSTFAEDLQTLAAAAATTLTTTNTSSTIVQVEGSCASLVQDLLVSRYRIPKHLVSVA